MLLPLDSLSPILAQRGGTGGSDLDALPCLCFCGIPLLVSVILWALTAIGMWKVFDRAGEPGWAALIPFYNWMVAARIAGRPEWHGLMTLCAFLHLPGQIVSVVFMIMIGMDVARSFGKEQGFGFGLGFPLVSPIFWMILGFSDAEYEGPVYVEHSGYRRRRRDYDDDYGRRRRSPYRDDVDVRRPRRDEDDFDRRPRRRRDEDDDLPRSRRDEDD